MYHLRHAPRRIGQRTILGILLILCLAGCARWVNANKPSAAFAADASACEATSFQSSTIIDGSDRTRRQAYLACLQAKGWSSQETR